MFTDLNNPSVIGFQTVKSGNRYLLTVLKGGLEVYHHAKPLTFNKAYDVGQELVRSMKEGK
jgi:hypothetical protein